MSDQSAIYQVNPFPCRHHCCGNRIRRGARDDDKGYENDHGHSNGEENAYHNTKPRRVDFWPTAMT